MCPWPWVGAQHLMELSSLSFEIGGSSGEELAGTSEYKMGGSPVQALLCCLIAGLAVAGVLTCIVSIWHEIGHVTKGSVDFVVVRVRDCCSNADLHG